MDTSNIIKLETNTYYDKQRKKFFFVTNLLDTLPPELFTMTKNEDGYYTKTGRIWKYYYKNPRCFPTKEQVYLLPFINRLKGDYWSNWEFRDRWNNFIFKEEAELIGFLKYDRDDIRKDYIRMKRLLSCRDFDDNLIVYLDYVLARDNQTQKYSNKNKKIVGLRVHTNLKLGVQQWKAMCKFVGVQGSSSLKKKQLIKAYMLADEPLRVSRKDNRIYFENGRHIPLD